MIKSVSNDRCTSSRGVDNFLGLGGGANKVKTKELQFGSRGRVREEDIPPPAQSAEAKIFFQNPRGVREQIRVIFK